MAFKQINDNDYANILSQRSQDIKATGSIPKEAHHQQTCFQSESP